MLHGLDHLLDRHLRGIEDHARFLVAEGHIRSADTVEPFQGSLDRKRSGTSGHSLDRKDHGRRSGEYRLREREQQGEQRPESGPTSHCIPFMSCPEWVP